MKLAFLIALCGAVGTIARYFVGLGVTRLSGSSLAWGTLTVNVLGSFAMGLIMGIFAARGELDSRLRIAITVGFLGGFTTYSSFALETVTLLERRQAVWAALYVLGTLLLAGGACWGGFLLARSFR